MQDNHHNTSWIVTPSLEHWGEIIRLKQGNQWSQYPGPDDRGLKFQREMTAMFPRVVSAWMGPFLPMLIVAHPETVRIILKSSGVFPQDSVDSFVDYDDSDNDGKCMNVCCRNCCFEPECLLQKMLFWTGMFTAETVVLNWNVCCRNCCFELECLLQKLLFWTGMFAAETVVLNYPTPSSSQKVHSSDPFYQVGHIKWLYCVPLERLLWRKESTSNWPILQAGSCQVTLVHPIWDTVLLPQKSTSSCPILQAGSYQITLLCLILLFFWGKKHLQLTHSASWVTSSDFIVR